VTKKRAPDVHQLNRKVPPIENHTGQRYPGTGGKVRASKLNDVVDEFEEQRDSELDVQQAGGSEPW
jgi:hypothetical protein